MKATSEEAFEALIEQHLLAHGYISRAPSVYDPALGLIPDDLLDYIRTTQPKPWAKLQSIHGDALEAKCISAFDKATADQSLLHVLRHGFKLSGKRLRIATFRPAHGLNPEVAARYDANRLAVVRQVRFDPLRPQLSIDLVLFLNGVPVVTTELKNAMTNQNAASAMRQYQESRDPDAPLFRFKRRALVHFAVGSDEVWMTTRLAGKKTVFLPFNRGNGTAAGNPPVPGKHRTSYLWEDIWQRRSLLDLLARFLHLQVRTEQLPDGKTRRSERMIFPRFHQLDCVRKLVASAGEHGAGKHYLIQHSTGSGKSNSIAWLAHRLASLHADDKKVFHCVVVITDRQVLDRQLQDTIYQIDHVQGVVQKIDQDSQQLADALTSGALIIITTLHKFGFIADKINELPDRRYAVIIDEAHSSQSGEMSRNMRSILGASSIAEKFEAEADDVDVPDQAALRAAISRGPQGNLSFFAFTATPKFKTLEMFGHTVDGKPAPFHLYSMRQAIEEEFILDVLRGYTTYTSYFELVKKIEDDPRLDKKKGSRALARFVSLHPVNIAQKTEVIIEHFRASVMGQMRGKAKAMVITDSRLHAVRYKRAFGDYLAEKGYTDVGALVAFSGSVVDPAVPGSADTPFTEPTMNSDPTTGDPLRASELPAAFAGPGYNVLIVANKYQTGFDQPLLCAMYVDKRLSGVQAVQTLSRLNRTAWGLGKVETFVLDFVNEREEILESFQAYYEGSTITDSVDPQRLYELQGKLDAARVYDAKEVDLFCSIFFKPVAQQTPADNGRLNAALDPAVDRFKALPDEDAEVFRRQLAAYCNLYGFLAQIVPFSDVDLEKLYAFGKMLLKKLPRPDAPEGDVASLEDDVALKHYRLQKGEEGDLELEAGGGQALRGPSATGTGQQPDTEQLSTLIQRINERFGTEFDAQDLIDGVIDQMLNDETVQKAAKANDRENFGYVGGPAFEGALVDRHAKHGAFIDKVFEREELLRFLRGQVLDRVYQTLTEPRV